MPCFKEKLLVPGAFFDKANIATLYTVNQEVAPDDTILYHHIEGIEAYLVETVISSFHDFVREHFSVVQIVNGAYPFILGAMAKALRDTEQIFLDIQDNYFDLLFIRDSGIQLFNTFSYKAMTDIVYFLLNCIKECGSTRRKHIFRYAARQLKDNKLKELLSLYLPNPYFAKEPLLNGILHDKEFNSSQFYSLVKSSSMRIISGTHKGKIITPDKNFKARPTTDFAKENLFNVLNNYIDIEDASVLDLLQERKYQLRIRIPGCRKNSFYRTEL